MFAFSRSINIVNRGNVDGSITLYFIMAFFQINISTLEELNILQKIRSIHVQHNNCPRSEYITAFYVARYNSSFRVSHWTHMQLILPNAMIHMMSSSRRKNR